MQLTLTKALTLSPKKRGKNKTPPQTRVGIYNTHQGHLTEVLKYVDHYSFVEKFNSEDNIMIASQYQAKKCDNLPLVKSFYPK